MQTLKSTSVARNILVVESDSKAQRDWQELLAEQGTEEQHDLHFTFVKTTQEALKKLAELRFDMLITEIVLPLVSGYFFLDMLEKPAMAGIRPTATVVYTKLKQPYDLAKIATHALSDIFLKQLTSVAELVDALFITPPPKTDLDTKLRVLQAELKALNGEHGEVQAKLLQCPRCHLILTADSYFCNNCGQKIAVTAKKTL